jgi:hypothetical protein
MAFIASGLLHYFPTWGASLRTGKTYYGELTYFFLQPFAVTLEDFVIYLGKKAGVKKSCKSSQFRGSKHNELP